MSPPTRYAAPASTLLTEKLALVSQQDARDRALYGPLFHGTDATRRAAIESEGFKIFKTYDDFVNRKIVNGYNFDAYYLGVPPPLHHLGFGIYFTTVKTIGKKYNGDSTKGLHEYFVDAPKERMGTVNSGVNKTMMKWWVDNGYPAEQAKEALRNYDWQQWFAATETLTQALATQYDAVLYKGGGLRATLDGNQLCVYKPELIYRVDAGAATGFQIGAKVIRTADDMKGAITDVRDMPPLHIEWVKKQGGEHWARIEGTDFKMYSVKWAKGGSDHNVYSTQMSPVSL